MYTVSKFPIKTFSKKLALPKFFLGWVSLQQPVPACSCLSCTTRDEKKSWKRANKQIKRRSQKLTKEKSNNQYTNKLSCTTREENCQSWKNLTNKQNHKRKSQKLTKEKSNNKNQHTNKQLPLSQLHHQGGEQPELKKREKIFEANSETNFYTYQLVNTTIFTVFNHFSQL